MLSTTIKVALTALYLLQSVSATPAPSATVPTGIIPSATYTGSVGALSTVGCFSVSQPLEDQGKYEFTTDGVCQKVCTGLGKPVLGMVDGTNCWCGDLLPPASSQVDNSSCNTPCAGYDKANCGGNNFWWVELTGTTRNKIANLDPASVTSSGSATTKTSTSSLGPSTVLVTATSKASAPAAPTDSSSSSKPNTVGIAVGVVVGVVAIAALIAGVCFFLRQKRRREVEEEYKRQLSVNQFVSGGHKSNSSMNDSRLDPELVRRDSTGSIADNQDYSRRILKVRNPDSF
ncbi:Nucleolar protein 9 [Venturia nashicola]|uniref:Nucleolar protein 9 n=1 Tax=Venturia nashicola TaxID=86259 RepID=A0A4Z1P2M7_9PEZI|nr:Nucleolar protein 9 [Venturia nashicola]